MPRILGVMIPNEKRIEMSLQYIYGIGPHLAKKVLEKTGIDANLRAKNLDEDQIKQIGLALQEHKVEGELRRETNADIKRLIEIRCYRGRRHQAGLPVRGQSSKTNARTRKGPRKGILKK